LAWPRFGSVRLCSWQPARHNVMYTNCCIGAVSSPPHYLPVAGPFNLPLRKWLVPQGKAWQRLGTAWMRLDLPYDVDDNDNRKC